MLVYFVATVFFGALLAPVLFWGAQFLVGHGWLPFLAKFDFETFFHRALLLAGLILLWPLLRSIRVRTMSDLALESNPHWLRDVIAGFVLAAIPLLCCGAVVIAFHVYSLRHAIDGAALARVVGSALVVPVIEETFFRGLVLGMLLRSGRKYKSIFATSAFYSIVHFLKAPEHTSTIVSWTSGFRSVANSFVQFADPMLVAAAFTTLFLIGWILADGRLIALCENGDLVLIDPTPDGYKEKARASLLTKPCRAEPALADGRLFARDDSKLICWNLKK